MYDEALYVLSNSLRFVEAYAAEMERQNKPFFAQEARANASALKILRSGRVACCEWRAAADQVRQILDAAGALSQALPLHRQAEATETEAARPPDAFDQGFDFSDSDE